MKTNRSYSRNTAVLGTCRVCGKRTQGIRTFCGERCEQSYLIGTDNAYLRRTVFFRDQGVCAICKVDTLKIRIAYCEERRQRGLPIKAGDKDETVVLLENLGFHLSRGVPVFWNADHIIPLKEGGELYLDNVQTLCVPCHKRKTSSERKSR